jgi:hypothetical protein
MKTIIAVALFFSLPALATEPTYEAFKKLQADTDHLNATYAQGGITQNGGPCSFQASKQQMFGAPALVMHVTSQDLRGPSDWSIGFDMNDADLAVRDEHEQDGSLLRTYLGFHDAFMTILFTPSGTPADIALLSSSMNYNCSLPR